MKQTAGHRFGNDQLSAAVAKRESLGEAVDDGDVPGWRQRLLHVPKREMRSGLPSPLADGLRVADRDGHSPLLVSAVGEHPPATGAGRAGEIAQRAAKASADTCSNRSAARAE